MFEGAYRSFRKALTCRGSSCPFWEYHPPIKSSLPEYILAQPFAFTASNTHVSAGPLTQWDGQDSQHPHIRSFSDIPAQSNLVTELPWCYGHTVQLLETAGGSKPTLGPNHSSQFQRASFGGQLGLGSVGESHACVLHLNRTLDAGVWECSIPSSYRGIPKEMVKLDFQLLWSSRMGVTHQGGGTELAHTAQCSEQVPGPSVTRVSLAPDEIIPWHPQSTSRPSRESGNYAEILYK